MLPAPALRRGFTLFEVAVSLVIAATAILSVVLVFPVGIKAQRLARYQIYACAKVLEIDRWWTNHEHTAWNQEVEADQLGRNPLVRYGADLETAADGANSVLMPLPAAIARRLDADDDEIQRVLDSGGRIFYGRPNAVDNSAGFQTANFLPQPDEARSLLFAVEGYAQVNALANHPLMAMPYYDFVPSPIQQWEYDNWTQLSSDPAWSPGYAEFCQLWNLLNAASWDQVSDWPSYANADRARLQAAILKAQELCAKTGVALVTIAGASELPGPLLAPSLPPPLPATPPAWSRTDTDVFPPAPRILAIRYLAQAANAWTGDAFRGNPAQPLLAGDEEYAKRTHDACLAWTMRYAAADPYDWGAPRPLNRQSCFDFPLLEPDLLSPPVTNADGDQGWRVVGRARGHDYGHARGVLGWTGPIGDDKAAIDASWGAPASFDLTAPFAASERCRELVCWSVDWQSYEDFESCPSEPADAMCYALDSRGLQVASEGKTPPEYPFWFNVDRTQLGGNAIVLPSGTPFAGGYISYSRAQTAMKQAEWKSVALGLYGADRNGNGRFDVGAIPASARMRATTIGRFLFYDRRLVMSLQN